VVADDLGRSSSRQDALSTLWPGFRAISVSPMLSDGRPVAVVTLLGPDGFRVATKKLYRIGF